MAERQQLHESGSIRGAGNFEEDPFEQERNKILEQQKEVKESLQTLRYLSQFGESQNRKQIKQIAEQLHNVLNVSLPLCLQPDICTSLASCISMCESYLSDIDNLLSSREQLASSNILANASENLALRGILLGKTYKPKQILLNLPEHVVMKSPGKTQVKVENFEFFSKQKLDTFGQTLDKTCYSVAANSKVGKEASEVWKQRQIDQPETQQCAFLSRVRCTVVTTAVCELDKKDLSLLPEVLTEMQKLERLIRGTNDVADVRKMCEEFFDIYGTHVNVGPLNFGGVSKSVATYSSDTLSETSSVRSLLNRSLSAHGEVEQGNDESRKVGISLSRTGGPQDVSAFPLWKSGLTILNNTWALIDWSNKFVGIWDLLQNHTKDLKEPQTLASTLKNAWQSPPKDSDLELRINKLISMVKGWLFDELFSTKCKMYLEQIMEVFCDAEKEANGLNYWLTKHVTDGPLDMFLGKLVDVSNQQPKQSLSVMRYWVRELVEPSPPESFFRSNRLLKWAQMVQECTREVNIPTGSVKTIPGTVKDVGQMASAEEVNQLQAEREERQSKNKKTRQKEQTENSHNDLLGKFGLNQYYPNKITLQQGTEIRACPDTLKACDLPWKMMHMLMGLDSRARDLYLEDMAKKQADDDGFKLDLSEYTEEREESNLPSNPMDLLLATFSCCDGVLQQIIAQKLFLCKLAIPFLYPVGTPGSLVFSLWALRTIIVQYQDASRNTIETSVTDHSFPIITFVRLGKTPVSKSRLVNNALGSHETFYSSECHRRTEKRNLAEGTLECSWFLPAFKKKVMFPNVTLFLNLRGDGSACKAQMNLVNKVSSLVVVVTNIENIAKPPHIRTFSELCKTGKKVILFLTSESKLPDMNMAQREWQSCITQIGQDAMKGIQLIPIFKKHMNDSDLKEKLQTMMPKLIEGSSTISLEEVAELCRTTGIRVDEHSSACLKGKQLAQGVMREMKGKHIVECKTYLLPLQGTWQRYSKLLKEHCRAGAKEASFASQHKTQQEMLILRQEQVKMCNNLTPFITFFLKTMVTAKGEDRIFFLQWMKLLLDQKSRQNLPELHRQYSRIWDKLHNAHVSSNKTKVEMQKLQEEVDQAEQNIADASIGLEHIFRELGQIFEAVHHTDIRVPNLLLKDINMFPKAVAEVILTGTPLELVDGDTSSIPMTWVKAVLSELDTIIGKKPRSMFVISVLGVQSSGKSTLLNTMFGLQFAVSAGRCTRGAFMQIIRVDRPDIPVKYIAVIDTEGLRAPELAKLKHSHDNELATLAIGLGDMTLINNKGENTAEIKDVLQIVVHAFMRMKIVNKNLNINQGCVFIHQNVPAINAKEKMVQSCQKLQEQLDSMTQEAAESENILHIKSFSQIIQFDIKKHVWYFEDLWLGNPPMAHVNHEYSESTETVKEHLLQKVKKTSPLTISDFQQRIQDLWNGVLADDFIFSFRNSLEMKAYNAMEEEYCALRWKLEKCVTDWIQQKAEIKMKKCETVQELESVYDRVVVDMNKLISDEVITMQQSLKEFFRKSSLQKIMIQWEQGKLIALQVVSEQRHIEGTRHLTAIKEGHQVDLSGKEKSEQHEEFLMKQAMTLADNLKGKEISDPDLKSQFEKMWKPMIDKLKPGQSAGNVEIPVVVETILIELYGNDARILRGELESQALSAPPTHPSLTNSIQLEDVKKEHLSLKTSFSTAVKDFLTGETSETRVDSARRKTFSATCRFLTSAEGQLSNFCHKVIRFQKAHAKGVLRDLKLSIESFNLDEAKNNSFSVLPNYAVKLAVHVSRHCIKVFSKMESDYEEKHGVDTKLKALGEKAWKLFHHTVSQSAEEVIAADLFCDQLHDIVKSKVESDILHRVVDEIIIDFSATKHQLIEKMLEELAKEENFDKYPMYTEHSFSFALQWLGKYTDMKLFSIQPSQSLCRYGELMTEHVKRIMRCLEKGLGCASNRVSPVLKGKKGLDRESNRVSNAEKKKKLGLWISTFCDVVDEIPVKISDLKQFGQRNIEDFSHLQDLILQRAKTIQATLVDLYCEQNEGTVMWGSATPSEQIMEKVWGCPAQCPFCKEPCSLTIADHYEQTGQAHRCLQHRPLGVWGIRYLDSKQLTTETCGFYVQSSAHLLCSWHTAGHKACTLKSAEEKDQHHDFKEYNTFFPEWDITPDPTNTASKYWAWFMAQNLQKLADYYGCKVPPMPPAWSTITKAQALTDLRKFR